MLYQITDGTVSVGGHVILSHVDFEIKGNEKIALVGRNGAGKTTLLKLIAGELSLDRDDRRQGAGDEFSPADRGDVKAAGFFGPGTDRGGDSSGGMPVSRYLCTGTV